MHLCQADAPVLEGQLTKTLIAQRLREITNVDVKAAIAFTRKGQHRIGTKPDFAVHTAREVSTKKRKTRIGGRVDHAANHASSLRTKDIVVTAKGDDTRYRLHTRKLRDTVRVQASTADHIACFDAGRWGQQSIATILLINASNFMIRQNLPATRGDFVGVCSGNFPIIDNACVRGVEGLDPNGTWLDLT